MTNPILDTYRNTPAIRERETFVDAFDEANGTAWLAAGQPDDLPGTEWWAWETEAMRAIEAEHGKRTPRDIALAAGLSPAHFVDGVKPTYRHFRVSEFEGERQDYIRVYDSQDSIVATGVARRGARSITLTVADYTGTRIHVALPDGDTFPRTDDNYFRIDSRISETVDKKWALS